MSPFAKPAAQPSRPAPTSLRTTELAPQTLLAAAAAIPAATPIYMVNLLRYREQAAYDDPATAAPCTGREAYFQRYIPAFAKVTAGEGITPFWVGNVLAQLVAPPDEHWDDVAIVEYPSFAVFQHLMENPAYRTEAEPHRRAALADWRLIPTSKAQLPG